MRVHGDPAYPLHIHFQSFYNQDCLTQEMEHYNKVISSSGVSFDWSFLDIICFQLLDKKNLETGPSS